MAHFIKMWNLLEDKKPGGTFNYSFFRIIIATEGDYLKDFPPNRHILYPDIGEKGRDPLDSLLGMEGLNKVKFYSSDGNGEYTLEQLLNVGYDLLKNSRVAEVVVYNEKGEAIPFLLDESLQEEFFSAITVRMYEWQAPKNSIRQLADKAETKISKRH
jgi:hypothetical protein